MGEKAEALKLSHQSGEVDFREINPKEVNTVIDRGSSFEGNMTFDGCVVINGRLKGEIFSEGSLVIGEGGLVEGRIEIGSIQVHGEVKGDIVAKEKIEIDSPAVVQGDIAAPSLTIKEGAVFEGNCSMGKRENQRVVKFAPQSGK
ncbi:MAG: polymer-forming cytoskeletal protein [Deltaproteobacteria bacterium]|nr:polymer-forming cytoskeletal protein [Deltaproteobacteria bacterium]